MKKHITRDEKKCFDCGACVSVCPTESIIMNPKTFKVDFKTETCTACGSCVESCSVHAIELRS